MTTELYPRGIKNLGNTCYVNALLQVFIHISISECEIRA